MGEDATVEIVLRIALRGSGASFASRLSNALEKRAWEFVLDLCGKEVSDSDIPAIVELLCSGQVIGLRLGNNRITNDGAKKLAEAMPLAPTLEFVSVSINKLGDEGCSSILEAARKCPALYEVDLSHNNQGPRTEIALKQLMNERPGFRVVGVKGSLLCR